MADLNDILQGLIDTDRGIISKLKSKLDELAGKVAQGSGTYAVVDINTSNITGQGVLTNDNKSSLGQCYYSTTSSSSKCIYSAEFPKVNYGHFAFSARVKASKSSTSSSDKVIKIKILQNSTAIFEYVYTKDEVDTDYCNIYGTFMYSPSSGAGNDKLTFQIHTGTTSGYSISFDYAYITMLVPAVYF